MSDQYPSETTPRRRSGIERFFGGSPGGVIVRLLLLSLVVGFLMSVFGVRPLDVVDGAINLFRDAMRDGFGVFRNIGAYILTGAVLVVPIWFLIRLAKAR
ncbi:DUF6460 domain-containing protein [Devosia psychrophila]|jgi:uncharacterized oligopeptide transporter (OPT) family protein|uniref:DUF6460 domain-containing protein n=1 Tax=Devosia psychrophila TaxID=728005 RepID=A0A0F5PXB3_9HYPH|nr:DUF6460 domain-containing protein [Devosia psychrophila]KKC33283.1 hypothetical protein WH91_09630 [Devosia psychrophila]SFC23963.1 hypothetical protein SAMN04488059_103117 [Devosia psychrophila]